MGTRNTLLVEAPSADCFPTYPVAWYLFGESFELRNGRVSKDLLGKRLVAFQTLDGGIAVLDARCSHLNADLGNGSVVEDTIQCPYHNWRYAADGRCVHIPAGEAIPEFARQISYPAVERHGLIFFFNGPRPLYPLPFFAQANPDDFVRARPFGMTLKCPWWLMGANTCDLQHFLGSHDRKLANTPTVEQLSPYARRAYAQFAVVGSSWRDRVTRFFSGDSVELAVTDWSGILLFVTAKFARAQSYGLLTALPLGRDSVHVRGIVFIRKSRQTLGSWLIDAAHLGVRRHFIKEFLRPDAELAARGLLYQPSHLLVCDKELARYFQWLATATDAATREVG